MAHYVHQLARKMTGNRVVQLYTAAIATLILFLILKECMR